MGTRQVSSNITDAQRGAGETGAACSQVLSAARSLSGDSNRLKLEVGNFWTRCGQPDDRSSTDEGPGFQRAGLFSRRVRIRWGCTE